MRLDDLAGVRSRQTPSGLVNCPLAVSAARGLAAVFAMQRICVYDLEDDDANSNDSGHAEVRRLTPFHQKAPRLHLQTAHWQWTHQIDCPTRGAVQCTV